MSREKRERIAELERQLAELDVAIEKAKSFLRDNELVLEVDRLLGQQPSMLEAQMVAYTDWRWNKPENSRAASRRDAYLELLGREQHNTRADGVQVAVVAMAVFFIALSIFLVVAMP